MAGTALKTLTDNGPSVDVNAQVGKENTQQLVANQERTSTNVTATRDAVVTTNTQNNRVTADKVETVVVNEIPVWVVLLALVGWLLPSPGEIGRWVATKFKKRKDTDDTSLQD